MFGLRRRAQIAYELIPRSAEGDPKIKQKQVDLSEPFLIGRSMQSEQANDSRRSPNGCLYIGANALVLPLAPKVSLLITTVFPKCSLSASKVPKVHQKVLEKGS